jgi:hypothetical protein
MPSLEIDEPTLLSSSHPSFDVPDDGRYCSLARNERHCCPRFIYPLGRTTTATVLARTTQRLGEFSCGA